MHYGPIQKGQFLRRLNRFSAWVRIDGTEELCHVKNTGRLGELLLPEAVVYLEHSNKSERKTRWDLIAVESGGQIVNIDSQAPNRVFEEWARAGQFLPDVTAVRREYVYGDSRLDFCLETPRGRHLVEVKGVTLEENGAALFPDAPTERGVKHIRELMRAVEEGLDATLFFVIQMENICAMSPNDRTHPAFGAALREAAAAGVQICARMCAVEPDTLAIAGPVPVIL